MLSFGSILILNLLPYGCIYKIQIGEDDMKKRVLATLLCLCLGLTPATVLAAGAVEPTGWTVTEVVPFRYDAVSAYNDGFVWVELDGKWGLIDAATGKEMVPCGYDEIGGISEGVVVVAQGEKYGVIDMGGKEVVPCKYDDVYNFGEDGIAAVELGGNVEWQAWPYRRYRQGGRPLQVRPNTRV